MRLYAISMSRGCSPENCRDDWAGLLRLRAEGSLSPILSATIPLAEVSEAHRMLDSAAVIGKIVLDCT